LEVIIGNNVVETIQNYNQVCNMVANCKLNYSQKTGVASAFGNINHLDNSITENLSSMGHQQKLTIWLVLLTVFFPIARSISSRFSPVRIQLTTESLEQMFAFSTTGVNSLKKFGTLL
jgi:hypothetical protein